MDKGGGWVCTKQEKITYRGAWSSTPLQEETNPAISAQNQTISTNATIPDQYNTTRTGGIIC
jgi:hypothetical protein